MVNDFLTLKDETLVKKYLRFTDPEDSFYIQPSGAFRGFLGVKLGSLSYGDVSNIKQLLSNPTEDIIYHSFEKIFRVNRKQYLSAKITEFMAALNYIKEEILNTLESEKQLFDSEPDPLMEEAGAKRLIPFGELNILKSLGKQFGKSPQEVETWNYNLVISLAVHENITTEIEKNYMELSHRRNGAKK